MNNARFDWADFPKLTSADDLENYIKYAKESKGNDGQRAYRHGGFFHYTSLDSINKILSGKSFLMYHPGQSNDPCEKAISEKERKFVLSFSTGIHENIPLWYLYGGINGKGGRLSFTKAQICNMVQNARYSLIEVKGREQVDGTKEIPLSDSDFSRTLQDVVYYERRGNCVTLKYSTMTNNGGIPYQEFEKFLEQNREFVKSLPWFYEKETRLLVELTDSMMQRLDSSKQYAVKLYFGDLKRVCKGVKLLLAPEAGDLDEILRSEKFKHIRQFVLDSSKIQRSEMTGQIKMNLCRKCPYDNQSTKTQK